MCVLYVSCVSSVRPRTAECVALGSAVLFILRSRLLVYSAGSGVQVVLSRFSVILLCFVQEKFHIGMVVCIFCCTRACVCRCDGNVIFVRHDLNRYSGWW